MGIESPLEGEQDAPAPAGSAKSGSLKSIELRQGGAIAAGVRATCEKPDCRAKVGKAALDDQRRPNDGLPHCHVSSGKDHL
jgi:hypothetical protein